MRLDGKRCLVTGGGSGIGRAVARRFADEGALVVVSGRRAIPLVETAATHDAISMFAGDVSRTDDADAMVRAVVQRHGGLDVLFHAAGVLRRNEVIAETSDDAWAQDIAANVTGTFAVCRAAIPELLKSRGAVVLVASQLAHVGASGYATYCAGKGAVLAFMRGLAIDLGPHGVRVNALSPGIVETEMASVGRDFAAIRDAVAATLPLRRVGIPEDLAGPAVFLASEEAAWMTGHALVVDGGFTAQ